MSFSYFETCIHYISVSKQDEEVPGGGDGSWFSRQLFMCSEGRGRFLPVNQLRKIPRLLVWPTPVTTTTSKTASQVPVAPVRSKPKNSTTNTSVSVQSYVSTRKSPLTISTSNCVENISRGFIPRNKILSSISVGTSSPEIRQSNQCLPNQSNNIEHNPSQRTFALNNDTSCTSARFTKTCNRPDTPSALDSWYQQNSFKNSNLGGKNCSAKNLPIPEENVEENNNENFELNFNNISVGKTIASVSRLSNKSRAQKKHVTSSAEISGLTSNIFYSQLTQPNSINLLNCRSSFSTYNSDIHEPLTRPQILSSGSKRLSSTSCQTDNLFNPHDVTDSMPSSFSSTSNATVLQAFPNLGNYTPIFFGLPPNQTTAYTPVIFALSPGTGGPTYTPLICGIPSEGRSFTPTVFGTSFSNSFSDTSSILSSPSSADSKFSFLSGQAQQGLSCSRRHVIILLKYYLDQSTVN